MYASINGVYNQFILNYKPISMKAYWARFRREKNYIFRELTRNFRELTRNFSELTRNFRE